MQQKEIEELFNKPRIIAICGDTNSGKSMLLYDMLETATKKNIFSLFYYGLRLDIKDAQRVHSVAEMEQVRDSIIIIDEVSSLFDLENRKAKKIIENTLRLIHHNNNVLVVCGTPENFKKFISAKATTIIYKKCTIADCINGSTIKNKIMDYNGYEKGSEILNLKVNEALIYTGRHYKKVEVKYIKHYDSKKQNINILRKKENAQNKKMRPEIVSVFVE